MLLADGEIERSIISTRRRRLCRARIISRHCISGRASCRAGIIAITLSSEAESVEGDDRLTTGDDVVAGGGDDHLAVFQ